MANDDAPQPVCDFICAATTGRPEHSPLQRIFAVAQAVTVESVNNRQKNCISLGLFEE